VQAIIDLQENTNKLIFVFIFSGGAVRWFVRICHLSGGN